MPLDSEAPIGFWDLIDELEGEVTRAGVESLSVHLDAVPQEVQANYADYLEEILGELYELRVTGFFGVPYVGDSLNAALMTIIVRGEEHVQQTLNSDRRVRAKGDMGAALDLYERLAAAATQPSSPAGPLRARFIDPYLFPPVKSDYVKGLESGVAEVDQSLPLRAAVADHRKIETLSIMVIVERGAQSVEITKRQNAQIVIIVDTETQGGGYSQGRSDAFTKIGDALRKLGIVVDLSEVAGQ
ncbi:hypothetical protein ACFQHV_01320 [Promicromonospora thailandica]|nr:hypothetical protein [Promicromonospora thailandica]